MNLSQVLAARHGAVRSFRSGLAQESGYWQDHRFTEILERHLEPLVSANELFDSALEAAAEVLRREARRLSETA